MCSRCLPPSGTGTQLCMSSLLSISSPFGWWALSSYLSSCLIKCQFQKLQPLTVVESKSCIYDKCFQYHQISIILILYWYHRCIKSEPFYSHTTHCLFYQLSYLQVAILALVKLPSRCPQPLQVSASNDSPLCIIITIQTLFIVKMVPKTMESTIGYKTWKVP